MGDDCGKGMCCIDLVKSSLEDKEKTEAKFIDNHAMRIQAATQKTGCIKPIYDETNMTKEEKFLANFDRKC
jgi:hypothetical protein